VGYGQGTVGIVAWFFQIFSPGHRFPVLDSKSQLLAVCHAILKKRTDRAVASLHVTSNSIRCNQPTTSTFREKKMYVRHTYIRHSGCINSPTTTSTMSCVTTTRLPVAPALYQLRCASRLLISWSHRLYFNHVVRHDYLYPGRTGSTSTMLCAVTTRLPIAPALHQLRRVSRLLVS
jgi:hypothetical protein